MLEQVSIVWVGVGFLAGALLMFLAGALQLRKERRISARDGNLAAGPSPLHAVNFALDLKDTSERYLREFQERGAVRNQLAYGGARFAPFPDISANDALELADAAALACDHAQPGASCRDCMSELISDDAVHVNGLVDLVGVVR